MRDDMGSMITLQLHKGAFAFRLVKKGGGKGLTGSDDLGVLGLLEYTMDHAGYI